MPAQEDPIQSKPIQGSRSRQGAELILALMLAVGCESPAETPVDRGAAAASDDDVAEHLRALGYLAWDENADQDLSGAYVYDASAVAPGANLYTNDEDTVLLIDEEGVLLRSWELPGRKHCEHVELLSSGRLAVLCEREALVVLEPGGGAALEVAGNVHHDVAELDDGSLLVPARDEARRYRGRSVVFDSILRVSADGTARTLWSSYESLEILRKLHGPSELDSLPSARLMVRYLWSWVRGKPINRHDYYHLNAVEVLSESSLGQRDARFRAGNLMISLRNVDTIAILDRRTLEPVWHWGEGVLELPHDPTWLPEGRLLVFDNGTRRGESRVLEVDPEAGEVLWRYPAPGDRPLFSEWRGSTQRLSGGNTLVCESERGHVLEVTPEGRVVWEFWNPELGEKGRKRIYRFTRLPPNRVVPLLASQAR